MQSRTWYLRSHTWDILLIWGLLHIISIFFSFVEWLFMSLKLFKIPQFPNAVWVWFLLLVIAFESDALLQSRRKRCLPPSFKLICKMLSFQTFSRKMLWVGMIVFKPPFTHTHTHTLLFLISSIYLFFFSGRVYSWLKNNVKKCSVQVSRGLSILI